MRNIQRLLSTEKGNSWESTIGMVRVSNNSSSQDLVKQCYNIILVSQQEWPETQSTRPNQMTNNRISQIAPTKTYYFQYRYQPMSFHLVPWILFHLGRYGKWLSSPPKLWLPAASKARRHGNRCSEMWIGCLDVAVVQLKWLWNSLKLTWSDHAWACHHHHHLLHLHYRNNRNRKTSKIQDGQKTMYSVTTEATKSSPKMSKVKGQTTLAKSPEPTAVNKPCWITDLTYYKGRQTRHISKRCRVVGFWIKDNPSNDFFPGTTLHFWHQQTTNQPAN